MLTTEEMLSAWGKELHTLKNETHKKLSCELKSFTEEEKKQIRKDEKIRLKKLKKEADDKAFTEEQKRTRLRREQRDLVLQEHLAELREESKQDSIRKNKKEEEDKMFYSLKAENNQLNSIFNSLSQAGENNYQKQQMLNASIATVKALDNIDWQLSFDAAERRR
jgi:hypothetical protein